MSETKEPKTVTLKEYVLIAVLSVVISLAYVGVLIVVADSDIKFDPYDVQIGMVDKDYCKYFLSNGACLSVSSFADALPRGLSTECADGFIESAEWALGRLCISESSDRLIENPLECNWEDCYPIGIVANQDDSVPMNYLPPAMKP